VENAAKEETERIKRERFERDLMEKME